MLFCFASVGYALQVAEDMLIHSKFLCDIIRRALLGFEIK